MNRWTELYVGLDMDELVEYSRKPKGSEQKELELKIIWQSVERVIEQSYAGSRELWNRNWHAVLFWLRSINIDQDTSKPFRTNYYASTVERYSGYWASFICFCLRILNHEDTFGIRFNNAERLILIDLRKAVEDRVDVEDKKGLDLLVLTASIEFIRHSVHCGYRPILIFFLGILGWDSELKVWKKAEDYTTILAGLQFCMRVLVLEFALPTDNRDNIIQEPISIFRSFRDQWLVEGTAFPFSDIHKLLNFGYGCSRNAATRPHLRWSPDGRILYWDNEALEIAAFKKFVLDMVHETEQMLSKDLLFRYDGRIPETNLYFCDDPTRRDVDYFWVHGIEKGFKKGQSRVMEALRRSEKWNSMVELVDGQIVFLQAGIDEYNLLDTKFRKSLATVMILTCGQTGRGMEMLSVLYRNTQTEERNLSVEHGQFMQITQHHKSFAIMDEFKVILLHVILSIGNCEILRSSSQSTSCSLHVGRDSIP
jgi:hypothetical protein